MARFKFWEFFFKIYSVRIRDARSLNIENCSCYINWDGLNSICLLNNGLKLLPCRLIFHMISWCYFCLPKKVITIEFWISPKSDSFIFCYCFKFIITSNFLNSEISICYVKISAPPIYGGGYLIVYSIKQVFSINFSIKTEDYKDSSSNGIIHEKLWANFWMPDYC